MSVQEFAPLLACGIWPALPLSGYWLLRNSTIASQASGFPALSFLALVTTAGLAVWSIPILAAAAAGIYRGEYLGFIGWAIVLLSLVKWRQRLRSVPRTSLQLSMWDWVLVAGLSLVGGLYFGFPTESILGGRDPGVYANHGIYIAHHGTLDVPYPWHEDADTIFSNTSLGFLGFYKTQPTMTVQFAHLFPVWLAQAFSTFGHGGLFRLNAVFALLSLCLFYGLCRAVVPRPYAVVATLFLALNPSQIWLARITMTEIVAQLFIGAGLLLLLYALKDRNQMLARWAGIFFGCSAFVRIDGFILIPLLFLIQLVLKFFEEPMARGPSSVWPALYQTALPVFVLALSYYVFFSTPYFIDVEHLLRPAGILCLVLLLLLCIFTPNVVKTVRPWLMNRTVFILISFVVGGVAGYTYWIRPQVEPYATYAWAGHFLDGTRDYREDSLVNLARYLSPPVVWIAIFGWLVGLYSSMIGKKNTYLAPLLVIVAATSAVYLWNPTASPDHFWAIRRFVPVVIPGFILFAALGIWRIFSKLSSDSMLVCAVSVSVFLVIFTLKAGLPIFIFSENNGVFSQLQQLAENLPGDEVILAHEPSGWSIWTTPLYVAFDRRVVPLNLHVQSGKKAFDEWVAEETVQKKPVHLLYEGESLTLLGYKANLLGKVQLARSYMEGTVKPLPRKIESTQTTISLYEVSKKDEEITYVNINLGEGMVFGVGQEGFYGMEEINGGRLRWTNGAAQLTVPLSKERLPQFLQLEIAWTGPKGARLQVLVNDCKLFQEWIPRGKWSHIFSLEGCPLCDQAVIQLLSDTFVPKESIPGSQDARTLGVAVRAIRLLESEEISSEALSPNAG